MVMLDTIDSMPEALRRYRPLIDDWPAFRESVQRPLPLCLRAHPARIDRAGLAELLEAEGFPVRRIDWEDGALRTGWGERVSRHWTRMAGLFQIQEEAAMPAVHLLDPRPGERILDLCAAPGNKTLQIAQALGDSGAVVANDVAGGRLMPLHQSLNRLGLINVATTVAPGQSLPGRGLYDRVLVDAPCSGEGTIRKSPGAGEATSDGQREALVARQTGLLRRAVELTRPGGRVVYATCTFAPEENEGVVDAILREFGNSLRLRSASIPGLEADGGVTEWAGRHYAPALADALRLWPHQNDTGGFFVAVLEVAGEDSGEGSSRDPEAGWRDADHRDPAILEPLIEHYGFDPGLFGRRGPVAGGAKYAYLPGPDLRVPHRPQTTRVGMPLLGLKARPPKLTTAGGLRHAPAARRNVLDLDTPEAGAYLRRESFPADRAVGGDLSRPGYVILRYRGYGLGVGRLENSGEGGRVASLLPGSWAGWVDPPV